LKLIIKTPEAS